MKKVTNQNFIGVIAFMFKIVRFPSSLENFFCSLKTEFCFGHLVIGITIAGFPKRSTKFWKIHPSINKNL